MNGGCPTNADSNTHGAECYFYWPCGHRKERKEPGAKAEPHTCTRVFTEARAPGKSIYEDDDDD